MSKGNRVRALGFGCALSLLTIAAPPASAEASMVASRSKCEAQNNVRAPEPKQERAMRCLIAHARHSGSKRDRKLERAAGRKVGDIFACGFSHTACGKAYDTYPKRFGYTSGTRSWKLGENLAWGKRKRGSARRIFKAWLASPPHRATLLSGSFEDLGIGLRRGRFSGHSRAAVWVLQLGCRGC